MLDFISVIVKNALRRPATRNYPYVKRQPYARQKGHIAIKIEDCIFCGMCRRKCPVTAIEVKRPDKSWAIDRFKCISCSACVENCPKKCLSMAPEPTPVARVKSVDVFRPAEDPAAQTAPAAPKTAGAAPVKPAAAAQPSAAAQAAAENPAGKKPETDHA